MGHTQLEQTKQSLERCRNVAKQNFDPQQRRKRILGAKDIERTFIEHCKGVAQISTSFALPE